MNKHVRKERRHKKERRDEGRGGEGREDDGTGVEFTHPAGSVQYWHVCSSVMSHPSSTASERK